MYNLKQLKKNPQKAEETNKDKNKTNEILLTKDKFNQYKHKFL